MFLQDTKVGDECSFCLKICLNPYRFCIATEEFYKLKYCSTVVYMVPRA